MSLRYYYANTASTVLDITGRCRLYRTQVQSNAEEGSAAISSLIIDDPAGDLVIIPFRRVYITETTAPAGAQVVYNGYVSDRTVQRGPYRTLAGREWVVQLSDPNWLIGLRICVGADANRPAEDDYTRIRWLLTTTEANTFNGSTQYVSSTVTRTPMDKVDYRGQSVTSIIDDCAQASGKNWWIKYFEDLGQYGLWYDFANAAVYDSTLSLANTLADVNSTTVFAISEENTTLERSPSRLVSGVYLPYDGSAGTGSTATPYVYVQNATVGSTYVYRDVAAPSVNVKTEPKATARANRYLLDNDTEDDVIKTEVLLPAASVNKIMHGMRIQLKATHLPGYETYSYFRVLNRTVTETSEENLTVGLELSPIVAGVEPFAILYRAYSQDMTESINPLVQVGWWCSGDGGPSPCGSGTYPLNATVGPLTLNAGTIPFNAYSNWKSITFNATGTIDFVAEFLAFSAVTGVTYTIDIKINGVIRKTASALQSGLGTHIYFTETAFAVNSGDVLTVWFHANNGSNTAYIDYSDFRITGGSLFA